MAALSSTSSAYYRALTHAPLLDDSQDRRLMTQAEPYREVPMEHWTIGVAKSDRLRFCVRSFWYQGVPGKGETVGAVSKLTLYEKHGYEKEKEPAPLSFLYPDTILPPRLYDSSLVTCDDPRTKVRYCFDEAMKRGVKEIFYESHNGRYIAITEVFSQGLARIYSQDRRLMTQAEPYGEVPMQHWTIGFAALDRLRFCVRSFWHEGVSGKDETVGAVSNLILYEKHGCKKGSELALDGFLYTNKILTRRLYDSSLVTCDDPRTKVRYCFDEAIAKIV